MCGIAGILRVTPREVARTRAPDFPDRWLRVLDESIRHRGPDGHGVFRDHVIRGDGSVADVVLLHRRLAIIDLQGGIQPMVDDRGEGRVAVVFNGCIYNHRELRKELAAKGRRFVTDHSDTEVFLHGWREWGEGLFHRLDGMFAVGLWDGARGELVLARDLSGEKPLYYAEYHGQGGEGTEQIAFASSPVGLYRLRALIGERSQAAAEARRVRGWVRRGFDEDPPAGCTWSLEPRSTLMPRKRAQGSRLSEEFTRLPARRESGAELSVERVEAMLERAVESRLESDVPLGCFLSGGVDSSLVASFAQGALKNLRTFSVRMPDERYDESKYAEEVARALGTRHTTLECDAHPAEDMVELIEQLGLPLGDSSLLPTHWVSKAARAHVTVALSGDGGDELFGGYDRYLAARWLRRAGPALAMIPPVVLGVGAPRGKLERLARLGEAARGRGYEELLSVFTPEQAEELGMPPEDARESEGERSPNDDPLRADFESYLPADLLRKVDTASMAVALEVRAPLLAREVVSACLAEPLSSLMPGGVRKALLKAVARRRLPAWVVDRPKQGFAIPVGEWLRSDYGGMRSLLGDVLHDRDAFPARILGFEFRRKAAQRLLDEHSWGRREHGQRLYCVLSLGLWSRAMARWERGG